MENIMKKNSVEPPEQKRPLSDLIIAALMLLFILGGLTTSLLDWFGTCTDACAEASLYRLFGLPMPPFGAAYFTMCAGAWFLRRLHPVFLMALAGLLFGGFGAELYFTWVQWKIIGHWCPICVIIAFCVGGACSMFLLEYYFSTSTILSDFERKYPMKLPIKFPYVYAALVFFAISLFGGLGTATLGLKKPDAIAAAITKETLAFGQINSSRTVYFISDWFCNACRTVEPEIVKGAQEAMKQAKVFFVDYPVHRETMNYVPFNISFMANEKEKYLKIREALGELTLKTKNPTPEEVRAAVAPLGVTYVPLDYTDVFGGTQVQMSIVQQLKPSGTPEVVIVDSLTGKTVRLKGIREITSESIIQAISEVSK